MRSNRFVNGLLALACLVGVSGTLLGEETPAAPAAVAEASVKAGADAAAAAEKAAEEAKKAAAEAAKKAAEVAAKAEALLKYIPDVVATAEDKPIVTRQQLLDLVKPQVAEALSGGMVTLTDEMVQPFVYQVANMMAVNEVILQAAKKDGITPNEKECEEQLKAIVAQVGGEDKLEEQFKAAGITREFFMAKMREQSVVSQFQEKLVADVKTPAVTEEEIKKFYEENKKQMVEPASLSAAHILIKFPSQAPTDDEKAAALKKAQEVKALLNEDGSNFAELAKQHSSCPSSERGGDLGKFQKGQMVSEFEEALLALKPGEISDPVETIFGYHLIKAGESTEERVVPFDEVKEELTGYLNSQAEENAKRKVWTDKVEAIKKAIGFKMLLPEPKMPEPPAPEKAEEAGEAEKAE